MKTLKDAIEELAEEMHEPILKELQEQGIPLVPVLKLQILQGPSFESLILEHSDILKLFSFYGEVLHISAKFQAAKIQFKTLESAYFAQKTLNNKHIPESNLTLKVSWSPSIPTSKLFLTKSEPSSENQGESFKYTCKYEIEVPNCSEFQVARRLIGPKGKNMKKIIETCAPESVYLDRDTIKLRLRGKGSGFKEGPFNEESRDPLHLCVSSKYYDTFQLACAEAERLIQSVYIDYELLMKKKGLDTAELHIKTMC